MNDNDINPSTTAQLLAHGAAIGAPRFLDNNESMQRAYVVVPEGYEVQYLEQQRLRPPRHTGTSEFFDAASFIKFVNQMKCCGNGVARIYARQQPKPDFVAVFNDDDGIIPGHGDFRAHYGVPTSVEWGIWSAQDKKGMDQETFAAFVENNLPDVVEPTAADFLEISRTLEAKKSVNFKSGIRLSDGKNQFTYEEDIKGTAANGRLEIPEVFTIGIPVLEGGPRYAVQARLRYRIKDGKLVLWYELVRPHKVMEDAAKELTAVIVVETGLEALNGIAAR